MRLYKMQAGLTGSSLQTAAATLLQTPLTVLYCPSRRPAALYPNLQTKIDEPIGNAQTFCATWLSGDGQAAILYDTGSTTRTLTNDTAMVCRNDYAGNGYDYVSLSVLSASCPTLATAFGLAIAKGPAGADPTLDDPAQLRVILDAIANVNGAKGGIFFPLSTIAASDIKDGLSNTYLLGEKAMYPNDYATGTEHGDQWNAFIGDDVEITR